MEIEYSLLISKTDEICKRLGSETKLAKMFRNCFLNTIETTIKVLEDSSTFLITGDIPAMWLRDSSAQVRQYIPFIKEDESLRKIVAGLVKRQIKYILIDPYANAFHETPWDHPQSKDITELNSWVWERKYEVDSLCYPIQLAYLYWKETNQQDIFDLSFKDAVQLIIYTWEKEQRHMQESTYRFTRPRTGFYDTIHNNGMGMPVNYTGMTWSGFRPSDDGCTFHYLIPSNMFACVVLGYMMEIADRIFKDEVLQQRAEKLQQEIYRGIQNYGTYLHPQYGRIYVYETDGFGNYNLMDDANVPSLMSIPYIGFVSKEDEIYKNTRRFILSKENPYYFEGKYSKGIGSRHTPENYIWCISLCMQALTSNNDNEIKDIVEALLSTDDDTCFMHEGFHADNPKEYSRPWFAWANSLFGELIYKLVKEDKLDLINRV